MKSPEEIKKELHQYIDNIEDEETLWMVHEEVADYLKKGKSRRSGGRFNGGRNFRNKNWFGTNQKWRNC